MGGWGWRKVKTQDRTGHHYIPRLTWRDTKPTDLELPFNPVRMFLWEEIEVPNRKWKLPSFTLIM